MEIEKNNSETKIKTHNWVQYTSLDDICTECGQIAFGQDKGIVYPTTSCPGKIEK